MIYPQMSVTMPWSLVKSGFRKTPHFSSVTQKPAGGRGRSSFSLQPYATWDFEVDLNHVLGGEAVAGSVLQNFLSVYMQCCGAAGFFLFTDPNDSAVTTQGIVLNTTPGAAIAMGQKGDGASKTFQLARNIGLGVDILQQVSVGTVWVNGVSTTAYTLSATGEITFTSAPANNATITWAGGFQYLCQFKDDTLDLARVDKNGNGWLWDGSSIAFESVFV